MAGSLRETRRGVWELRVYLGRDERGKVRHRQVTFHGAKREAERHLRGLIAEFESGSESRDQALIEAFTGPEWGADTTFNDALEGWRLNGWDDLSPSTTRRYRSLWDVHIGPGIGHRRIATTSAYEVERFFRGLKASGQSQSSVRQARAMLHRACRLARRWSGNRLPNPVAETELPEWRLSERSSEQRAPTVLEVRALLKAASADSIRIAAFIRVVAATGARRGEICALRWSDIDWTASSLRLDEAIVAVDGGVQIKGPKTRASVRSVAIDPGTLAELQALRAEQEWLADQCGLTLTESGFVFATDPSGAEPPNPDSMSHAFARVRKQAGVALDIHLHSLRHFQSTELDPVISEAQKQSRMGWSTVQMARHYTDSITEEDARAAAHIGRLLSEQ